MVVLHWKTKAHKIARIHADYISPKQVLVVECALDVGHFEDGRNGMHQYLECCGCTRSTEPVLDRADNDMLCMGSEDIHARGPIDLGRVDGHIRHTRQGIGESPR